MLVWQSLTQVVLAPHQSPAPASVTDLITAAPLAGVPHWTRLEVAGVLTVGLRLPVLTTVLLGVETETLDLPGPDPATTGSRALAPLSCPPLGRTPLTLHHSSLGLQYRVAAHTFSLTSLLGLWLGLLTAVLGLQLISSPLVETLDSPPPEAATTGGAAG